MRDLKTRKLVLAGALAALMIVLNTLGIGIVPIPPIKVTILHVPVIIGTLVGGWQVGVPLGLFFGLYSLYGAYAAPVAMSVCFMNPVISVFPRVMIPLVTYGIMKLLRRKKGFSAWKTAVCAVCGSYTNTVLVLGLIGLLYGETAAAVYKVPSGAAWGALAGVAVTSGIPEALVCAVITTAVCAALHKAKLFDDGEKLSK